MTEAEANATAADQESPAPASSIMPVVTLEAPIQRGDMRIDILTLREPKAGELRGLTLTDLLAADVGTIIKLTPRISMPTLTEQEVADLGPADIAKIAGEIRGFFLTKAERKAMDAMIAAAT